MAVTGPIPLPQTGMQAFDTEAMRSQKMMASMLQGRQRQQQLGLNKEQLDIHKQAEARAQKIMPHLIEKYKREMLQARAQQKYLDDIMGGNQSGNSEISDMTGSASGSGMDGGGGGIDEQSMPQNNISSENLSPEDMQGINNLQPGQTYTVGGIQNRPPIAGKIPKSEAVQMANQDQAKYDQSHGQQTGQIPEQSAKQQPEMPQQQTPQQISPETPQSIGNQNPFNKLQERLKSGEEVVIRPPTNPRMAKWDKLAGQTVMGIKIPKVQSETKDGIRYDVYPSGLVKARKEALSATEQEQQKVDIKRAKDLEETGKLINKFSQHSEALTDLFENKGLHTGNLAALRNWTNMPAKHVGTFMENSTPLVGQLSKELSQRGGAVVSGMAAAAKPDLKKPDDYNKEILNELHKQTYHDYQAVKAEYERITGKEYPIKLSKFYEKVKVQSPHGVTAIRSPEEAEKLVKKYPGSKILGNAYE
jgi:hypothetical protein